MLEEQLGPERLAEMRTEAETNLAGLEEQVEAVNNALRVDATGITVPAIEIPEPDVDGVDGLPLVDSDWSHADQCRRLINHKAYGAWS
jgi:hypothetical protein